MTEPKTNKEESSATHEPGSHIVNVTSISQSPESISVKNEPITHQSPNNNSTSYSSTKILSSYKYIKTLITQHIKNISSEIDNIKKTPYHSLYFFSIERKPSNFPKLTFQH